MNRTRTTWTVGLGLLLFVCVADRVRGEGEAQQKAAAPEHKAQTLCPVTNEEINRSLFVEHNGKRIYLCCKDCIAVVNKDPAKYIKKLEDGGVVLEKVQTTCPVEGGKINKKMFADHDGKRVYFCCGGCDSAFKKDPAKYLKKLEDAGVTPEPVPVAADKASMHHEKDKADEATEHHGH